MADVTFSNNITFPISSTCGGLGFGLLALPVALLGPHLDRVVNTGPQAGQDSAGLLLLHWNLPDLSISRGVAHHIPVNVGLHRVPGDSGCILCHLVGYQVFRAINF